jgi:outer membrane protein assembly factor BamE (lipoprotein component of BamABCDE complex)
MLYKNIKNYSITLNCTAIIFLLCITACNTTPSRSIAHLQDNMPSAQEFLNINTFPYTPTHERINQIKKGLVGIKFCMNKKQVKTVLGNPDYSQVNCSKYLNIPCHGSTWVYYISKRSDSVNIYDPHLSLFFDKNNRLHRIAQTGIDDATPVNNKTNCPIE